MRTGSKPKGVGRRERSGRAAGAVCVVLMMLAVASVPLIESIDLGRFGGIGEADAEASPEYIWSYTLSFEYSTDVAKQKVTVAASGYDHNGNALGTLTPYSNGDDGSWAFDSNGIGPMGSFYAAFDAENGNRMLCILNPENLKQSISGTALSSYSSSQHINIMWVLPTVYWSVSDGKLTLTNDPYAGGTAYAHTLIKDGKQHVYQYMAIGVYEAYQDTIDKKKVITSESGKTPTALTSITDSAGGALTDWDLVNEIRAEAANQKVSVTGSSRDEGEAMVWNFYMWQLYRFTVAMTGENWRVWNIFGNGDQGKGFQTTGQLDASGPFAGVTNGRGHKNETSPVKAYIENAWGSEYDFVDGVYNINTLTYLTQKYLTDETYQDYEHNQTGYAVNEKWLNAYASNTTEKMWGMPVGVGTHNTSDVYSVKANGAFLMAGGLAGWEDERGLGICTVVFDSISATSVARLAFVFDHRFLTRGAILDLMRGSRWGP